MTWTERLVALGAAFLVVGTIYAVTLRGTPPPDFSRHINFWIVRSGSDRAEWHVRYGPRFARFGIPVGVLLILIGVAVRLAE